MYIVFLNPPSLAHDTHDLAPPLWALLLGAIAQRAGLSPHIIDLNLEMLDGRAPQGEEEFYAWCTERILHHNPSIVCYSSMALNGHVSLKIAELIKGIRPSVLQFFGGPHFSAIAEELIQYYPWVDAVFLGEAERPLMDCLRGLHMGRDFSSISVPGIISRSNASEKRILIPATPDDVPSPAYDLIDVNRYFRRNPRKLLNFEAGRRGCIYSCRYCYAPQHFGQGERAPTTHRFIAEMAAAADLGAKHLFIVADNFVNYPKSTIALCDEIASARLGLTFNCYATLAQLNEHVVAALSRAGCTSVYVGVDAVHPDARREFAKGLFRSRDDLLHRIDLCLANGIAPNLAFLLEEPAKSIQRFEDTVATALAGAIRGCTITFNTLTVYPRTKLAQEGSFSFSPSNLKARICFDAPNVVFRNSYSHQHPELFPFHSSHRSEAEHGQTLMLAHALKTLCGCAPKVMLEICERGLLLEFLTVVLHDTSPTTFSLLSPLGRRKLVVERLLAVCESCSTHSV